LEEGRYRERWEDIEREMGRYRERWEDIVRERWEDIEREMGRYRAIPAAAKNAHLRAQRALTQF
jgi:hypothetical protein